MGKFQLLMRQSHRDARGRGLENGHRKETSDSRTSDTDSNEGSPGFASFDDDEETCISYQGDCQETCISDKGYCQQICFRCKGDAKGTRSQFIEDDEETFPSVIFLRC